MSHDDHMTGGSASHDYHMTITRSLAPHPLSIGGAVKGRKGTIPLQVIESPRQFTRNMLI